MSRPCRKCQDGEQSLSEVLSLGLFGSGSGYIKCPKCKGDGNLRDGRLCHRCNGNGRIECPRCEGSGTIG